MAAIFKHKLGSTVKDKLTGYTGIIVGRTEWQYGCKRYGVQSKTLKEDGSLLEPQWFDEPQLEVVRKAKKEKKPKVPHGPRKDPVR